MAFRRNTNLLTFGPATPAVWPAVTHGGVWDAETGGNFLGWSPLVATLPSAPIGSTIIFPIGTAAVEIPHSGEFTADGADAALAGWPDTVYTSLHSAAPTDTGANELSGNGYARQSTTLGDPTDT